MPDAFFHRPTTHQLIANLSRPADWTIYVGLGATIDRTGISWWKLIDALLASFISDPTIRVLILERHGEIRAATIAQSLFRQRYEDANFADRIGRTVGDLLYGPHKSLAGRLLESIASFALEVRASGHTVSIVTPNYDDYLHKEFLTTRILTPDANLFAQGDASVSLHVADTDTEELAEDWRTDTSNIPLIHLHGYVAEKVNNSEGQLVISESDYARSHDRTVRILGNLFKDRNVLIIGSSVTDPPLVDALMMDAKAAALDTPGTKPKRMAILPAQDGKWQGLSSEERAALEGWDTRRLREFGVEPIRPDFYIQSAQLLMEIQRAMSKGIGSEITLPVSPHRYGSRLTSWWDKWFELNCAKVEETQAAHHKILANALMSIRTLIAAPPEESLKLEVWIRWNPHNGRELRLWASSVGTWPDLASMRRGDIEADSKYKSVAVFCQGSPTFMHEKDPSSTDRWRSYLGLPIWLEREGIPAAVATLASMRPPERSSLSEDNMRRLAQAMFVVKKEAGKLVIIPE